MNYLSAAEYQAYGLEATTGPSWITAASMVIDSYCRRATLAVAQYAERLRVAAGRNTVRLTYLPLAIVAPAASPLITVRGRYATPRRGEWAYEDIGSDVSLAFGLPGTWLEMDPSEIDCCTETGELTLPINALGLSYGELDVVYTAGVAVIPEAIKVACAQIVKNAQATPALNVRAGNLQRMHLEYFSDSLVDQNVRAMLAPYIAQKVG
jgi:hypothetical protein